jgi:hypothetical protein
VTRHVDSAGQEIVAYNVASADDDPTAAGTRERLATDALLATGEQDLPVPDTGSLRGDLAGFAAGICQYLSTPLGLALARALATPTGDPAVTEASARYFQTRFEIASTIVDRAIARDEIPEGADWPGRPRCWSTAISTGWVTWPSTMTLNTPACTSVGSAAEW